MKLVNQTETTLVLEDKGIVAFVVGGFFVAIGIGVTIFLFTQRSSTSTPPFVGLIGVAIGAIIIALQRSIRIEMDKTQGIIAIKTKKLIGGASQVDHAITDVVKVQMIETMDERQVQDTVQSPSGRRNYHTETYMNDEVVLLFKDGSSQTIESSSRQVGGLRGTVNVVAGLGQSASQIGANVATFLGVPFEQTSPVGSMIANSVQQAVQQVIHPNSANTPSVVPTSTTATPPPTPPTPATPSTTAPSAPPTPAPGTTIQPPTQQQ